MTSEEFIRTKQWSENIAPGADIDLVEVTYNPYRAPWPARTRPDPSSRPAVAHGACHLPG